MTNIEKSSAPTWTDIPFSATSLTFNVGDATGLLISPTYSVQQTFSGTTWTNVGKN